MLKARYIGGDEQEKFSQIVTEKQEPRKGLLQGVKTRVDGTYEQYLERFEELKSKANSEFSSEEDVKSALKHCYTSETQSFTRTRSLIFNGQPDVLKSVCPFCMLDKPKTLDHYICKSEFPEYSTLIKNLVPCCYDCNNIKLEVWRENNVRSFIHFYYDDFFDKQFLSADIELEDLVPKIKFKLVQPSDLSDDDFAIITAHFSKLDLLEQYNSRCNTLLSSEIRVIRKARERGDSLGSISQGLLDRAESEEQDFGINYWKAVLYRTAVDNIQVLS